MDAGFSPATTAWFRQSFAGPTPAQHGAWASIASGDHTLVIAPTGSGKTLAAFLYAIDRLQARGPQPDRSTSVLYISPLKALAVDVERNLRAPLAGIRRVDPAVADLSVGLRSGDTPAAERRRLVTHPPDILITTPESLYLMLTSGARETLAGVGTVIVDEVHAVAGNKRGAHLALSLERLAELAGPFQRIGLSATVRPVDEVAGFLGGGRPVTVVAPPAGKEFDLRVQVPVPDLANPPAVAPGAQDDGEPAQPSVWPHVEAAIVDQIAAHTSTLVFTNSRRLSERLTARLNEIWAERTEPGDRGDGAVPAAMMGAAGAAAGAPAVLARAHHGSVSKERRREIEDDLKSGRLRAVVATSSLELGIDMGAVDLVIQVQAPPGVSAGLQRVGRAGHQVGAVSRATVFPTHRGDLLAAAVTVAQMTRGELEPLAPPRHPLDVLAQQIVAMTAMADWHVDELYALVRRAWSYRELPRSAYEAVVDMLAGLYPSEQFAGLRPRLVWDRTTGMLTARPGAQRLAVTSGGTIPDRGHFGVFLVGAEKNTRVGELDEEMVYESRVGDVIALGSSSWRIEEITTDRVLVSPAPGQAARLPFWHGDTIGRSAELGTALGEALDRWPDPAVREPLDPPARENLDRYLAEQVDATGVLPGAATIVVEQFRDELGDRRVVVHSPYGARVHAPWALILADRLQTEHGVDAQVMPGDDGIVLRLPDDGTLDSLPAVADFLVVDPLAVTGELTRLVGGSALFAARFRECAARSLLFPRRDPTKRAPLWQQRQRSAQLLSVAAGFETFPVVLETVRECLQDVYDVGAVTDLMTRIATDEVRVVEVATATPSPFARSLLFAYVAAFLYEGDSPLAERKSAALALDEAMLTELLGTADLRDLLDPASVQRVEQRLQRLGDRAARTAEEAYDLVREIGPLRADETADRGVTPGFLASLTRSRRIFRFRHAGVEWHAAVEDAGNVRDGLGVALPTGLPHAMLTARPQALTDLVARFARCHGPFVATDVAQRFGLGVAVVRQELDRLARSGMVLTGAFRPGGTGTEWCHPDVLRAIRRASAAAYRDEIEPVEPARFARFPPAWQEVAPHGSAPSRRGVDGVFAVIEDLAGCPVPASQLEHPILAGRVRDYHPGMLDELTSCGEVLWWGVAPLPKDGWICLAPADQAGHLLPPAPDPAAGIDADVLALLASGGGWFAEQLRERLLHAEGIASADVEAALWRLVWSGAISNDSLAPLRGLGRRTPATRVRGRRARTRPRSGGGRWSLLPAPDGSAAALLGRAELLLQRHGLVTRGAVLAERLTYTPVYRALAALEDRGRCRRGYVVEGLGGAQFGLPAAIDRIRSPRESDDAVVHVLAAADPANPYGAALPWPESPGPARPGRKAGALVVLVAGRPVCFVERGGSTVLVFPGTAADQEAAAAALVHQAHQGRIPPLAVRRITPVDDPFAGALERAGAVPTPGGLRARPR